MYAPMSKHPSNPRHAARGVLFLAFFLAEACWGQGLQICGDLANHYGPYDYWTDKGKLTIVEQHHFTAKVEALRGGQEGYIGGDLDYTLHTFPNHPRALAAMVRLTEKEKKRKPLGANYPVECYFDRAIRFRPKDGIVRMLFGSFLIKDGKKKEALEQLDLASSLGVGGPNIDYNMGLAFFEVGEFEKSLTYAHRAYQAGYNLPGLKSKLVKVGKWREPSVETGESSSATGGNANPTEPSAAPTGPAEGKK